MSLEKREVENAEEVTERLRLPSCAAFLDGVCSGFRVSERMADPTTRIVYTWHGTCAPNKLAAAAVESGDYKFQLG